MHRDIKSLNILVADDLSVVLTDFGHSKLIDHDNNAILHTQAVGSPLWMAPEVRLGRSYNYSSDIFSVGLVYFEILENTLFGYDRENNMQLLPSTFKVCLLSLSSHLSYHPRLPPLFSSACSLIPSRGPQRPPS